MKHPPIYTQNQNPNSSQHPWMQSFPISPPLHSSPLLPSSTPPLSYLSPSSLPSFASVSWLLIFLKRTDGLMSPPLLSYWVFVLDWRHWVLAKGRARGFLSLMRNSFLCTCCLLLFSMLGAYFLFKEIGVTSLSTQDYLAIGAIFLATDSVCTLQVLNQEETPLLYSLLFGEGVVNDAIPGGTCILQIEKLQLRCSWPTFLT